MKAVWLLLAGVSVSLAYRPVVLWHGMGDDCCNPKSMGRVTDLIREELPGTFVHSVQVGKTPSEDHQAGFFGVVNEQVDTVCEQLANITELQDGFNAIGFSQGGLFLRTYVERCNRPPVHNLVTFGSPHGGVSDIPRCMSRNDFSCGLMRSLVRRGAYTQYVQHHVVQAQYYKDPSQLEAYMEHNILLPDLNNEMKTKNQTYKDNIAHLNNLVMVSFSNDTMVKPAQTAWFWTYDKDGVLVPLQEQRAYREDWLGLRTLDESGRLANLECPGEHMQISDAYLKTEIVWPYLAGQAESPAGHLFKQMPMTR